MITRSYDDCKDNAFCKFVTKRRLLGPIFLLLLGLTLLLLLAETEIVGYTKRENNNI